MMRSQADKRITTLIFSVFTVFALCGCVSSKGEPIPVLYSADGSITVCWNEVCEAVSYRLYRRADADTDFKYIKDVSGAEYNDTDVKKGASYQYKVQALFTNGTSDAVATDWITVGKGEAVTSSEAEALTTADVGVPLKNPTVVSVTRIDKYTVLILLDNAAEKAEYEILRSETADGEFQLAGTALGKAFYDTDAEGTDFFYIARAKGNSGTDGLEAERTGFNAVETANVPVMMYHEFVTEEDIDSGVAFDEYTIWQSELESDLVWLLANGYTTITSKQLVDYIEGNGTLPEKPIILSIDDGKFEVYKRAYPLLQKYNAVMVLAVIGERIDAANFAPERRGDDDAPYCIWSEIGEMAQSGLVEIISHTQKLHVFHNNSNRQGASTKAGDSLESFLQTARLDFTLIRSKIKQATGNDVCTLAYPYSIRTELSDAAWLAAGYKLLFCGDDDSVRKTRSNFFAKGEGITKDSAIVRRVPRMTGTPIGDSIGEMTESDNY